MSDRKRHTLAITFGTNSGVESTLALLQAELPRLEEQRRTLEQELAAVTDRLDAARAALTGLQTLAAAPALQEAAAEVAPAIEQAPEVTVPAAAEVPAKRRTTRTTPQPTAKTPPAERTTAARKTATGRTAAGKATGTPSAKTRRPAASSAKSRKAAVPAKPAVAAETAAAAKATVAVAKTEPIEPIEPMESTESAEPKKRTSGLAESILAHLAEADGPARAGDIAQALGRETTPGSVNAVRTALERLVKASKAQRSGRGLYLALPS